MMKKVNAQIPKSGFAKMAFLGEAPGADEVLIGKPFVGPAGRMFNNVLRQAAIERDEVLVTNVFDFKLGGNSVASIGQPKPDDGPHPWPQTSKAVETGIYIPKDIAEPQFDRLWSEFRTAGVNVVVPMGATAVWAMLGISPMGKMKKARGSVTWSTLFDVKTVPTYHPAYIRRNYNFVFLVVADLIKARNNSDTAYPPNRELEVLVPTTAQEVENFLNEECKDLTAVDIETFKGRVDCIGFASVFNRGMCVPLFNYVDMANYWSTEEEEKKALKAIARYLRNEKRKKVFQNGGYDVQWLWEKLGMVTRGWTEDTRLLHHSLWPESPKDLATIASLHLDVPNWKVKGSGRVSTKKED